MHKPCFVTVVLLVGLFAESSFAQQPLELDLVTIGSPGNRPTIASEVPDRPDWQAGSVGYEYRMMRTELTVAQHFEFAQAYLQFNPQAIADSGLLGPSLARTLDDQLVMFPETANMPSEMSWHMTARLCNWYHNGKVNAAWAFETGAYDTSTFVQLPDGSRLDQLTRSPDARYWIPSINEWIKAVYYDPNRYGTGLEGYWRQPNGTNEMLISGYPLDGGQTNAGWGVDFYQMDVGQYPQVQSPWGLLDVSGGRTEWSEGLYGSYATHRTVVGSTQGALSYLWVDPLEGFVRFDVPPDIARYGIRLATVIPAPGSGFLLIACAITVGARRRRCGHAKDTSR
ncbi:hypothetical protein LBMAG48_03790 [Phycisphaerae bacterium]|nr:hypothetical protein LBMAG48_03790 [Phycisphaerae bacterium]